MIRPNNNNKGNNKNEVYIIDTKFIKWVLIAVLVLEVTLRGLYGLGRLMERHSLAVQFEETCGTVPGIKHEVELNGRKYEITLK